MSSLAEERVKKILLKADNSGEEDVSEAISISEKTNTSLPGGFGLRVCDRCQKMLHPGKNASVRVSGENICYRCRECGCVNRHGY